VVGLGDCASLTAPASTVSQAGAAVKLRLGDFQHDGVECIRRVRENDGNSGTVRGRHDLELRADSNYRLDDGDCAA